MSRPTQGRILVSVIVPVYRGLDQAYVLLASLCRTASGDVPLEFIVQVDPGDGRLDPAVDFGRVATDFVECIVETNSERRGFAGNCNAGAARARGEILFFVNQDAYAVRGLSDGWDRKLLAAFADPGVGIVGPLLLFPDGRVQSAGGLYDAKRQPFHRYLGESPGSLGLDRRCVVSWTTGAALATRVSLFGAGFDTGYHGGYFEDTELCVNVRARGLDVLYDPSFAFVHRVASCGGNARFESNARRFRERNADRIAPDVATVEAAIW